jgi:hypothetical protein
MNRPDPAAGRLDEFLRLPSGGDSSDAGLRRHEGALRVGRHSSRERRTTVYPEKVQLAL